MNGDGIYHAAWPTWDWRGVGPFTVRYCRIEDNKRQGIAPNVGDWHIHNTTLGNQGGFNIDLEDGKNSTSGLPSTSGIIEDCTFEPTTWSKATFYQCIHINITWGWNDSDGPPNRIPAGPWTMRRNTITGFAPVGSGFNPASDVLLWFGRWGSSAAKYGSWSDYTRLNAKDARGYAVAIEDNVCDLPASERIANVKLVRARAVDGLFVSGNTLQNTSIDAPTSGYAANTSVTVSGNT